MGQVRRTLPVVPTEFIIFLGLSSLGSTDEAAVKVVGSTVQDLEVWELQLIYLGSCGEVFLWREEERVWGLG